jgi:GNAT superfamily N-acetyltransferase
MPPCIGPPCYHAARTEGPRCKSGARWRLRCTALSAIDVTSYASDRRAQTRRPSCPTSAAPRRRYGAMTRPSWRSRPRRSRSRSRRSRPVMSGLRSSGDRLAGVVALDSGEAPDALDLAKLFVEPSRLHRGIGRALLAHAVAVAGRRGAPLDDPRRSERRRVLCAPRRRPYRRGAVGCGARSAPVALRDYA